MGQRSNANAPLLTQLENAPFLAASVPRGRVPGRYQGVVGATSSTSVGSTHRAQGAIRLADDELGAVAFDADMDRWRLLHLNVGEPLRKP